MVLVAAKTEGKTKPWITPGHQALLMFYLTHMLISLLNRSRSPVTEESPSFAQSTRASRLRGSQSPASSTESTPSLGTSRSSSSLDSSTGRPKRITVHGKPYVYHNGDLVVKSFGFLMSTKATVSKFGVMETRREEKCRVCRPPLKDSWGTPLTPRTPSKSAKSAPKPCPEPPKPTQIMSQQESID